MGEELWWEDVAYDNTVHYDQWGRPYMYCEQCCHYVYKCTHIPYPGQP